MDVEYSGKVPDAEFSGSLLRTDNPSVLLNALSLTDKVYFEIRDKKDKSF